MIEIRCKNPTGCSRFLKIEAKSTFIAEVTCPDRKCKFVNKIKIVNSKSSEADIRYKFSEMVN